MKNIPFAISDPVPLTGTVQPAPSGNDAYDYENRLIKRHTVLGVDGERLAEALAVRRLMELYAVL